MWYRFLTYLHHALNPHCSICADEREAAKICAGCEILKTQLEVANYRNEQIIKSVLAIPEPEAEIDSSNLQPIKPRFVPFHVRRARLEELDRARAQTARNKKEHEDAGKVEGEIP